MWAAENSLGWLEISGSEKNHNHLKLFLKKWTTVTTIMNFYSIPLYHFWFYEAISVKLCLFGTVKRSYLVRDKYHSAGKAKAKRTDVVIEHALKR